MSEQPDFKGQKEWLREVVEKAGHEIIYFPKFHCELNYIELIWAYFKGTLRRNCEFSFDKLKVQVEEIMSSIPLPLVRSSARHCYRIMDIYRLGVSAGPFLDYVTKKYKGHRRLPPEVALQSLKSAYEDHKKNSTYSVSTL